MAEVDASPVWLERAKGLRPDRDFFPNKGERAWFGPWLYTWGSGRFSGVARDAEYLAQHIETRLVDAPGERHAALNEAAIGA
jgi:hypothetical protein